MKKILSIVAFLVLSGTAHAQVVLTNLGVPWPQSATQLFAPVGNCTTAPAYSFNGDPNTGVSSGTVDVICLVAGGASVVQLTSGGVLTDLAGGSLVFAGRSRISSGADNVLLLQNNAATDFSLLQMGGTTSSFPALQRATAGLYCRLADDSGYCPFGMSQVRMGQTILISSVAPVLSSACGTSPAFTANGTAAFRVVIGTGGTDTTCVVTLPTASTGWACNMQAITAAGANRADRAIRQTAFTTTTATFQYQVVSTGAATAFTAADVIVGNCLAF